MWRASSTRSPTGLLALQSALRAGTWRPGGYVHFHIHEPKRRRISAAPFADRVVHHALCNLIEPLFERLFIPRQLRQPRGQGHPPGRGPAAAASPGAIRYVLRLDIVQHFPVDRPRDPAGHPGPRRCADAARAGPGRADHRQRRPACWTRSTRWSGSPATTCWPPAARGVCPSAISPPSSGRTATCTPSTSSSSAELGCRAYLRYVDDIALFARQQAPALGLEAGDRRAARAAAADRARGLRPGGAGRLRHSLARFRGLSRPIGASRRARSCEGTRRLGERFDAWRAGAHQLRRVRRQRPGLDQPCPLCRLLGTARACAQPFRLVTVSRGLASPGSSGLDRRLRATALRAVQKTEDQCPVTSGSVFSGNGGRAHHTKADVDVAVVRVVVVAVDRARVVLVVVPGAAAHHARLVAAWLGSSRIFRTGYGTTPRRCLPDRRPPEDCGRADTSRLPWCGQCRTRRCWQPRRSIPVPRGRRNRVGRSAPPTATPTRPASAPRIPAAASASGRRRWRHTRRRCRPGSSRSAAAGRPGSGSCVSPSHQSADR